MWWPFAEDLLELGPGNYYATKLGLSLGDAWTFDALTQHNVENFFTSGNILHVIASVESPTPTIISKSENLLRKFDSPVAEYFWPDYPDGDKIDCYGYSLGNATNPFAAVSEDTPIYYF